MVCCQQIDRNLFLEYVIQKYTICLLNTYIAVRIQLINVHIHKYRIQISCAYTLVYGQRVNAARNQLEAVEDCSKT